MVALGKLNNEVRNPQANAPNSAKPQGKTAAKTSSNATPVGQEPTEGLPQTDGSGFTPVVFICEAAPELGFRGMDGKRTKFTNKRYEARSSEELAHMRKLISEGGLSVHGVREIDRGNAERIAQEYLQKVLNQGRAMKGGMHSAAANLVGQQLMQRDTELNQTVGPENAAKLRDAMEKDGLIITETANAGVENSSDLKDVDPANNPNNAFFKKAD